MIEDRLEFAVNVARQAGQLLLDAVGTVERLRTKDTEVDLVTEHDERAEKLILDRIEEEFPGEAILSEESGAHGSGSSLWVVDPLDGTTNFAHGIPIFSVSIAYLEGGRPSVGVVFAPALGELFAAARGRGAHLNGQPLRVSATSELGQALLVTGFPYDLRTRPDNNLDNYARLALTSRAVRRLGSAALDLCYVAAGRFDGYWELVVQPWDIAAGVLMVEEAGGIVSTVTAQPMSYEGPSSILAANAGLRPALMSKLNGPKASED